MLTIYYKVKGKEKLIKTTDGKVPEDALFTWYDFEDASEEENQFLATHFEMRPYTREDMQENLTRPKYKAAHHYEYMTCYLMDPATYDMESLNVWMKEQTIVTYHKLPVDEFESVKKRLNQMQDFSAHDAGLQILDQIVDHYFDFIYKIEDHVVQFEKNHTHQTAKQNKSMMNEIFVLRSKLIKLRSVVIPMNELLAQMLEHPLFTDNEDDMSFLHHIDGHLDKQENTIRLAQEMTNEIRDNYDSFSNYHMNRVMQILTLFSTIFLPPTLIAGIYGMNFKYMPELEWHYGYFITLGVMLLIAAGSFLYFRIKHWY